MSVEWFDLGMRLRAASSGCISPRLLASPVPSGGPVVAVRARVVGKGVRVTASAAGHSEGSAEDDDALELLGEFGVSVLAPEPVRMVTDAPATVAALAELVGRRGSREDVAAHVGWWLDRADFPGGSAVVDVLSACRSRFVTGLTPAAENESGVWREWLGVTDRSTAGVLDLYAAVSAGAVLRHLDELAADDVYAFGVMSDLHSKGADWRAPQTRARAAVGLRSRCDAADLYADALLGDPLWRARGVHTGHVVSGVLTRREEDGLKRVEVRCDRLDARLRPGREVTGWVGGPMDSGLPFTGKVTEATISGSVLMLIVSGVSVTVPDGSLVAMHESGPGVWSQRRSRSQYAGLYRVRSSWLSTGRAPVAVHRDVPLDVLVAGASGEDEA